jgi:predicted nucleotide-binding protein (sugar kinase/HSP70/actin superfamily)
MKNSSAYPEEEPSGWEQEIQSQIYEELGGNHTGFDELMYTGAPPPKEKKKLYDGTTKRENIQICYPAPPKHVEIGIKEKKKVILFRGGKNLF